MIQNIFKIAFRNLMKSKLFSVINILGLAFGLTCSILISFWVWDEMRIDKFHSNGDDIFKVLGDVNNNGDSKIREYAPSALAQPLLEKFPEITQIARVFEAQVVFETSKAKFSESGIYADSSLLTMFSFPLKEGRLKNILSDAQSIVISQELAEKYFPGESALGKSISIVEEEKVNYVITGVLKPIPKQSSLQFDYIMAYDKFQDKYRPWWNGESNRHAYTNFNIHTYVTLIPGVDLLSLNEKLDTFIGDFTGTNTEEALFVYPFTAYYLHADFSRGRVPTGKIQYVNLLSTITFIVLLIACINFMNLSTARAGKRAKEVGLRKTIGSTRRQLLIQFMVESILIAFISMFVALTLADMLMPAFNLMTNKYIEIPFSSPVFILVIVTVGMGTGILAGCYPAFYLSAFSPIKALKNYNSSKGSLSGVRRGLVIVQFTLSIVFIVFTLVVSSQIGFIQTKNLGIKRDNIVHHPLHGITTKKDTYKKELLNIPGVQSVVFTEQSPFNLANGNQGVSWKGKPENEDMYFNVMQVSEGFVKTFELELIEGTGFPENYNPNADRYFIINEAAAELLNTNDPIGLQLQVWGKWGTVVGLARNYHHRSLEYAIEPVVMLYNPDETFRAYIGIESTDIPTLMSKIGAIYAKYEENYSFDYSFVDDEYNQSYTEVITIGKLANIFSLCAIFISCLGLFGLSAFITEQRTKETGIRKVLGASEWSLLRLFSKGFVKLVLFAFIVAVPIAWLYSKYWLSDYAYRIELGVMPFVIAGVAALLIALLTVSYNTIKAASANPVDSLKY
jgi:putative ABC transport system permease protein